MPPYPHFRALYAVPVRQVRGLLTASFRFRLTADTLAVRLCASSLPTRTWDFHPLEYAHAGQSSRGDFLSPLTPPYMPFGIRRFNITSKHDAHLRFAFPAVRYSMGHTFDYTVTLFSPSALPIPGLCLLRPLLTSHSSLLLLRVSQPVRPHGISLPVFPHLPA